MQYDSIRHARELSVLSGAATSFAPTEEFDQSASQNKNSLVMLSHRTLGILQTCMRCLVIHKMMNTLDLIVFVCM